ncbi:MAG: hypothetical protein CMP63_01545 [Flavobacteriales bacterium]|nr:hypothetical protein [Flavobacteriales bacterium]
MFKKPFFILFVTLNATILNGQNYCWTGKTGNLSFFDEKNWLDTLTGQKPDAESINPGKDININLTLTCEAEANAPIHLGTGILTIENGILNANSIHGGYVTIGKNGYLNLSDSVPLLNHTQLNFSASPGWLRTLSVKPYDFHINYISQITANEQTAIYPENIRIDNYYSNGSVIRKEDSSTTVLKIYSGESLQGDSGKITPYEIYKGENIPNNLENNIQSFILCKGYMATISVNIDGMGKSKVFIASESDLVVEKLPVLLSGGISFIRVIPWNWAAKKGVGGLNSGLNDSWHYLWSNNGSSTLNKEYSPMAWGSGGTDEADITKYKAMYKTTHILGFNEPDDCNGQSGQYNNLCIPDTAVMHYKNLMKTGLRMVSPACREQAWDDWLDSFNILAKENDVRIDVIAVHWYDWGGNPKNSPDADPNLIFGRFKNYLTKVYNHYQLPVWITEFNANLNRTTSVNYEFMKLAIPYLDSLDYVERYAWFQPVSDVADFYDTSGAYTSLGTYYKKNNSFPSIPERIYGHGNNLENTFDGTENNTQCSPHSSIFSYKSSQSIEKSFTLYPNPVNDKLNISSFLKVEDLRIYTLHGQLRKIFKNKKLIDVNDLPRGMYIVKINHHYSKTFIKN